MQEYIVEFDNVTKKYPRKLALDRLNLTLPQGKVIGLIGPNGSGKSTLLKITAGLVQPSNGSVKVLGIQPRRTIASQVAYLSEMDILYPFYTVRETIDYYGGLFNDFDKSKAEEMLNFMQLDMGQKVKNLSKGNRGRLKIILTLSRNVPLVLLDEPLSGLDPLVRDNIIKSMISFLNLPEQTVVITTHEITEVEPVLDTVVLIKDGKVQGMAEVDDIRSVHGKSLLEWMKEIISKGGQ